MATYVSGRSGNQTKAKLAVEQLQRLGRYRELDPLSFAVAYIGMGESDKALLGLEKAYREHSSSLTALKVDSIYAAPGRATLPGVSPPHWFGTVIRQQVGLACRSRRFCESSTHQHAGRGHRVGGCQLGRA
jgi:hypothetical protein